MKRRPLVRAVLGGLVGTCVMLAFLHYVPVFLQAPRHISAFGIMSTFRSPDFKWADPIETFVLGTFVFPLFYAILLYKDLQGAPWRRGLVWGLTLWVVRGAVVMPIMGLGFFALNLRHPISALVSTLIAHVLYGIFLGIIAGDVTSQRLKVPARRIPVGRR